MRTRLGICIHDILLSAGVGRVEGGHEAAHDADRLCRQQRFPVCATVGNTAIATLISHRNSQGFLGGGTLGASNRFRFAFAHERLITAPPAPPEIVAPMTQRLRR